MTLSKAQKPTDQAEYWRRRENVHLCFMLNNITLAQATDALLQLSLSSEHIDWLLERWAYDRKLEDIHTRFMGRNLPLLDAAYELKKLPISQERAGQLLNDWEDRRTFASFTNTQQSPGQEQEVNDRGPN